MREMSARPDDGQRAVGGEPGSEVTIREARPRDLEIVSGLEQDLYSNPWRPETFRSLLDQDRGRILVAEDPVDGVVGYAVYWWVMDQAELANLAVERGHQGNGVGRRLLDNVVEEARDRGVRQLFLEVRWSNHPALRLYTGKGFTQVSVRRGYYQKPKEDARILVLEL